jgi:hypothetical protein
MATEEVAKDEEVLRFIHRRVDDREGDLFPDADGKQPDGKWEPELPKAA